MSKNVLIIGSGGREHAICWKLSQSLNVKQIYASPGSYGIGKLEKVKNIVLDVKNHQNVINFCKNNNVDLVAVGPEDPLAGGIADALTAANIACFGPNKNAAKIESDKSWAKEFMDKYDIPTARWSSFTDSTKAQDYIKKADHRALVIKASGLAAGKGVVVAENIEEACFAVHEMLADKKFGKAGEVVVVEEFLEGEEVSLLAFTDGVTIKAMLPSQDHKRISEGDQGLNTGGMGAYCPCLVLSDEQLDLVQKKILNQTIMGLNKEGIRFVGVLYAGLILTEDGPKVLEYNCRFGDPETEVILPLLDSDLYEIMESCCSGTLIRKEINWKKDVYTVGVVMASRGYPVSSSKGQVITGIDDVNDKKNKIVFHCGTALSASGSLVTNGGRVLIAVVLAPKLFTAAMMATEACRVIKFEGAQYRKDIAYKGIARALLCSGSLTYKQSGVDIEAGESLVNLIKPLAKSTARSGLMGGLGGFGGLFDVKTAGFSDPILVSGTDGVGTKLKIAQSCNKHNTIGIDLVAMCINDVLAHGAEPLFFLDYFACGTLDVEVTKRVVEGIAEGCRQAKCALIGGETAEMPGMYPSGVYDLAGFAVGAVERSKMIPHIRDIRDGDVVIGLPSTGLHSNGFSLVRRVMQIANVDYSDTFAVSGKTFGDELLVPTKIYIESLLPLIKTGYIKGFAHITGGGLLENIPRILPSNTKVEIDSKTWKIHPIFGWLAALGEINEQEMLRTFNCGIGGVIIVSSELKQQVLSTITDVNASVIGKVIKRSGDESQVVVKYFKESMTPLMQPHLQELMKVKAVKKKRVGVLISGSGTNLQSLIDSSLDPIKHMGVEIVLVISNKPNVEGLKRAERANIPTMVVKHSDYPTRQEFDRIMHQHLIDANVEIVCLAGFMRILSGEFVQKWHGRLLNIHPALLPLFKGTHAQKQALDAGVKVSGCTVHFVNEDVDAGAIIAQETVPILHGDTEDMLAERIKIAEHKAYPYALRLLATGKIHLGDDNKLVYSS